MTVLEALTDEEAYLAAILQDESGLDLAEFTWYDAETDDAWRAWPFQWSWYRDISPLQIEQSARSVGKSLSIKLRAFAFPFIHPGQEMVITAPEKVHLDAVTDSVETQLLATRLTRELLTGGRASIKHQPFHVNFQNGSRIMGRIPQRDGKGVKGVHPIWLELDEAQDYPPSGWTELVETLKRGHEGAVWRAHGVTRGVRDHFYKFTQPNSGWKIHHYVAMCRPTWTAQERKEKIEQYGSENHPDYRRNVLGAHGDATSPIFVLHRLMAIVDDDETSEYNTAEYQNIRVTAEMLEDRGVDVEAFLNFPATHLLPKFLGHWVGMDVGYTQHPSEILVFGEHRPPKSEASILRLLSRVHLERMSHGDQIRTIVRVCDFYKPKAYSLDKTGLGLPLFQDLQERYPHLVDVIKGYNFSSKILVDFDQSIPVDPDLGDPAKEAGITRNVLEYSTDVLREYVDAKRVELPWDRQLIGEFQGGTVSYARASVDQYGRRKIFSGGDDHALDASRMAVLGHRQYAIEALMKADTQEAVLDSFIF